MGCLVYVDVDALYFSSVGLKQKKQQISSCRSIADLQFFLRTMQLSFGAAEIMTLKVLKIFDFKNTYFCVFIGFNLIKIINYKKYVSSNHFQFKIIKN